MTEARDAVLSAVRRQQPAARALPDVGVLARQPPDLLLAFSDALQRLGGVIALPESGESLERFIARRFPQAAVVCSATAEVAGNRVLPPPREPQALADVDLGVVRGAFGVAETGSVFLSELELGVNALGYLPQHLLVLLDPRRIVADLHAAYRQPQFRAARYGVLMTGPTATADIEGVLVRGAQGIRSLTVVPRAEP